MGVHTWLWVSLLLQAECELLEPSCRLLDMLVPQTVYKEGDVVIGGLFPVHYQAPAPDLHFRQRARPSPCHDFSFSTYRWLQTMIFAVEEINRNSQLLPNLTLGYALADTCLAEGTTLGAALSLVTGKDLVVTGSGCGHAPWCLSSSETLAPRRPL
ncbi:hypothetical protein AAFF_G00186770 [Aldrovandia affinis]|uniref:Receptor ligand binding region domain-containing protein n=1 Tax=Aldrovandia affinis TaxID=143900 RepID=A0AAD7SXT6_9TELE|nr:hypothetical protein AAFF_G00186770 [Aldrovandia affinis]